MRMSKFKNENHEHTISSGPRAHLAFELSKIEWNVMKSRSGYWNYHIEYAQSLVKLNSCCNTPASNTGKFSHVVLNIYFLECINGRNSTICGCQGKRLYLYSYLIVI